ncbi:hypothetical protein GCM10009528_23140 [Kineococcus aurantiacus]
MRRTAWTEAAGTKQREARRDRIDQLEDARRKTVINRAVHQLRRERELSGDGEVILRSGFIWADLPAEELDDGPDPELSPSRSEQHPGRLAEHVKANVRSHPPLARLAHRGLWAQRLELVALALASFRSEPGIEPDLSDMVNHGSGSWSHLLADPAIKDPARRRMLRALERLDAEYLVNVSRRRGDGRPQWQDWTLLAEDGSAVPYTAPQPGQGPGVPAEFWTNGWVYVLTPPEITSYFMIRHLAWRFPGVHESTGVGCAPRFRRTYGVTSDTYTALNELVEFGLIAQTFDPRDVEDEDSPRHVSRFQLTDDKLKEAAHPAAVESLRAMATPRRLARYAGTTLDDLFKPVDQDDKEKT